MEQLLRSECLSQKNGFTDPEDDTGIEALKNVAQPILGRRLFHGRCVCRILNSCIQKAWESVKRHVTKIRFAIARVLGRHAAFCKRYGLERKPIAIDSENNWDSTRDMLRMFVPYRDAVDEFIMELQPDFKSDTRDGELEYDEYGEDDWRNKFIEINDQEWEIASVSCKLLDVFYEAVSHISATYSPSSSVVLLQLVNIAKHFSENRGNAIFQDKFSVVEKTFLEHCSRIPELYSLAAVMDPRIKLSGSEFLLESFYRCTADVKVNVEEEKKGISSLLHEMYNVYTSQSSNGQCSSSVPAASGFAWSMIWEKRQKTADSTDSEIAFYLQTAHDISQEGVIEFDILSWWKKHAIIYPVLSSMARDLLTVHVSTLAADCAFTLNEDRWILDEITFKMEGEELEMYTCLKDWFHAEERSQSEKQRPDAEDFESEEEMLEECTGLVHRESENKELGDETLISEPRDQEVTV